MSEICCVVDRCWGASDVCLEAFLEKLSEKRQKASAIYDQTIVNLMRRRKLESSSKSEQRCYYGFVTFWQRSLWEIRVWFQNSIKFLFTFQTNLEKPIELGMTNWVNDKICMKIESLFPLFQVKVNCWSTLAKIWTVNTWVDPIFDRWEKPTEYEMDTRSP